MQCYISRCYKIFCLVCVTEVEVGLGFSPEPSADVIKMMRLWFQCYFQSEGGPTSYLLLDMILMIILYIFIIFRPRCSVCLLHEILHLTLIHQRSLNIVVK